MKKISHILSAVDFSDPAIVALDRAGMIAREHDASLLVFHAMRSSLMSAWPRGFDPLLSDINTNLNSEIHDRLDALANKQKHLGNKRASSLLAEGGLESLVSEVKKHHADLVVAGAHGAGYWHELFIGSFISKLIAHNPVPTLVVKDKKLAAYKKILIPVDFSSSTTALIEAAKAIAPQAEKILLHVVATPHEGLMRLKNMGDKQIKEYRQHCAAQAQQKLDECVEATQDTTVTGQLVAQGHPSGAIAEFQRDNGCDLIVIGKHGTDYLSDLLVGSVTKLVLSNTTCDTLVTVGKKAT